MTDWPLVRVVIGREYRAWRKPFLISSAIILLLTAVGLTVAYLVNRSDEAPRHRIAVHCRSHRR